MASERRTPVCKVSVDGSPLGNGEQARLIRASVDLDADLFAQTTLLFMDPSMELINGTVFESGKAVELKMGYDAKATSVFAGEVVRLEPQFRRDEPVALKVVCQDSLHRLALTPMTRAFNDADMSTVVTAIAQEHGLSADAPSGTKQHILQNNVTDAEFLKRFANRMGMRLRLEDKKLTLGPLPATSPIPLTLGDGVKKLKVKRKAGGQVDEITVHGWDPKTKQEVVGKGKPLGDTGKGARDFGAGTLSDSSGDLAPPDVSTAEGIAKGRMKKIAEGYATLQAELIGDSRYLPGQIVEIDKLGPGTDGSYRIERARHEFNKHGYYVKFDAVWQGPKTSPKAPKPPEPAYVPPKPEEKGRLTRPRWKRRTDGSQDVADLNVDASKPLEGKSVKFILESKIAGEWKQVATADGTVKNGFANATAKLDPVAPADVVSEPKWTTAKDSKHEHGQTAEVSITSKVQKAHDVKLILEQQLPGGRIWEKVEAQTVKVSGGSAKAKFDLEHPSAAEADKDHSELIKTPVWSQKPGGADAPGVLSVETPGLEDGRKVKLIVERLGRDGKWGAIRTLEAKVDHGSASAMVDIRHTIEKPQPSAAKQLASPKWEQKDHEHGEVGKLSVDAQGLDGQRVRFIVERNEGGKWQAVTERLAKVADGKASAEVALQHPNAKAEGGKKLGEAKHDPKTGNASVDAGGLDGRKVRFTAEKKTGSGWVKFGSASGVVKGGKVSANVSAPQKAAKIEKPTWSTRAASHGDEVDVSVLAKGLDGSEVEFALESLEGGKWVPAGTAKGKVKSGKAAAKVTLEHPAAAKGTKGVEPKALGAAEHDPKTGQASIAAQGLDGRKVRFIAEKETAAGWAKFGSASGVVKGGKVSAKVSAPQKEGGLEKPTWSTRSASHGDEVDVSVLAKGLDGSEVEFALERLEGSKWVPAGIAKGKVASGKATARVTLAHGGAGKAASAKLEPQRLRFRARVLGGAKVRVRAELLPDLEPQRLRFRARLLEAPIRVHAELLPDTDARKLRFRAEVVPDMGAQKLRFRAEPIPDLRPRKLRFRVEVPVPESPGLTRLRVELQGGTPDDHVQTGSGGE